MTSQTLLLAKTLGHYETVHGREPPLTGGEPDGEVLQPTLRGTEVNANGGSQAIESAGMRCTDRPWGTLGWTVRIVCSVRSHSKMTSTPIASPRMKTIPGIGLPSTVATCASTNPRRQHHRQHHR